MKRFILAIMLPLAVSPAISIAQTPAATYSIVSVPAPHLSAAAGLNNKGDVFGNSIVGHSTAGFLVSGGKLASVFSGAGVEFAGITDSDQIAGKFESCCTSQVYAFLASGQTVTYLDLFGGFVFQVLNTYSAANAVNNGGDVVGEAYLAPGQGPIHGFLYTNGTLRDLGTLGGTTSSAQAINNSGQITGTAQTGNGDYHAFLFANGFMFDLGLFGVSSSAVAINDNGEILIVRQMNNFPNSFEELFVYQNGKTTRTAPGIQRHSAQQYRPDRRLRCLRSRFHLRQWGFHRPEHSHPLRFRLGSSECGRD
jgi:probable HAF family extracellular repeat protein